MLNYNELSDNVLQAKIDILVDYREALLKKREEQVDEIVSNNTHFEDANLYNMEISKVNNYINQLDSIRRMIKVRTIANVITKYQEEVVIDALEKVHRSYYELNINEEFNEVMANGLVVFEENIAKYGVFLDTDYRNNERQLSSLLFKNLIDQRTENKNYMAYITLISDPNFEITHKKTEVSKNKTK